MIERIRSSEFVRHGALLFAGVGIGAVCNYLFYILISRRATVEVYGEVTALVSAISALTAPAMVVQMITARIASDVYARNDRAALGRLADVVGIGAVGAGAFIALGGILLRAPIAAFFKMTETLPIALAAVALGLSGIVIVQRGVFQGAHRFGDFSASTAIEGAAKVAVGDVLVIPYGAAGAIFGVLACQLANVAYAWVVFRRAFGTGRARIALDPVLIRRVVAHVGLSQLVFTVLMFFDLPLIKHAFDPRSAGLYAAATLVGRAVLAVLSFVPILVMPKATARVAAGLSPLPILWIAVGLSAALAGIAILAAAIAPRTVVQLIAGRAFGDAAPLVLLYVSATAALASGNVVAAYQIGLHRYDFVLPVTVIAVIEIVTFALWHPTLLSSITVLFVAHVAILCATFYRINVPVQARAAAIA